MRRVYTKKSDAKEKALRQLRETRAKLTKEHPKLMKIMREKVQALHDKGVLGGAVGQAASDTKSDTHIDKDKNITTVIKFLELKDETGPTKKAIRALLSKHIH